MERRTRLLCTGLLAFFLVAVGLATPPPAPAGGPSEAVASEDGEATPGGAPPSAAEPAEEGEAQRSLEASATGAEPAPMLWNLESRPETKDWGLCLPECETDEECTELCPPCQDPQPIQPCRPMNGCRKCLCLCQQL